MNSKLFTIYHYLKIELSDKKLIIYNMIIDIIYLNELSLNLIVFLIFLQILFFIFEMFFIYTNT